MTNKNNTMLFGYILANQSSTTVNSNAYIDYGFCPCLENIYVMKLVICPYEDYENMNHVLNISSIFLETCNVKCWLNEKMAQLAIMQRCDV